jgi:FixJ family two-component response regulator
MTKLTTPVQFDALLQKLQRAMRGADDADVASALLALLFHRLTLLDAGDRQIARDALSEMLNLDMAHASELVLAEGRQRTRLLRITS